MKVRQGGKDSFDVVKSFLARVGERTPELHEVVEISGALEDIHNRLMRVRSVAPSVDLSERMWALMNLAGVPRKSGRGFIRSAAML